MITAKTFLLTSGNPTDEKTILYNPKKAKVIHVAKTLKSNNHQNPSGATPLTKKAHAVKIALNATRIPSAINNAIL
jgi:hypothetical protein